MITAYLNGIELPMLEIPFLKHPVEKSVTVETLDGNVYVDFIALKDQWEISWASLTDGEYETLWTIYESQFITNQFPLLDIPYYNVVALPVRMTINTKDIWNNCGSVQNVTIELRQTVQLGGDGSS